MKNTKAILAGTLMAPVLALTGGIAYASTTTPSHPATARAAVTASTAHPVGQMRLNWCDWRYTGYWGDRHNYGHQAKTTHQRNHHVAYQQHGYRHHQRSAGRTWGNQGYGYQGGWGSSGGSHRGDGGCCRHGW